MCTYNDWVLFAEKEKHLEGLRILIDLGHKNRPKWFHIYQTDK